MKGTTMKELDIFVHIRPTTKITWNRLNDRFYVVLDNLGLSAFKGEAYTKGKAGDNTDKVTIFAADEETAIRLVSVLQVIRQRITAHRDRVVEKLTKVATVDDRLKQARADIARTTGASIETVL